MLDVTSLAVSALALFVSVLTAWLTLFKRGTIKMTRPTVIAFIYDPSRRISPKIWLRTLLYPTSKQGRVVESMYISMYHNDTHLDFTLGAYGDDRLLASSGFFIGEGGLSTYHHFLLQDDASSFRFSAGEYRLDVYAVLVGDRKPKMLFSQSLRVSSEEATQLQSPDAALFFNWSPSSSKYLSHLDESPSSTSIEELKNLFQST